MLGYKNEHKLLDICLRLDMMSADEVRWTPYRIQEIRDIWVSTWHGMLAYFDCVEVYMPDRVVRQFGWRQCIPAHPIRPKEARRPVNNRMYMVKNTFVEALWLEAPSHLLTETWISVPAVTLDERTDDYMQWFTPRTHPRIQNPNNIPLVFMFQFIT
ncbi:hypothetical protein M9H77_25319 [Catharanthus roseus]|uniref:Uncharacterized protein n=1 Tax=Catharanthus roseus TaxID=4058 RepID=A0ACC0A7H3_CATRO|nr:hypothetical protein M9H77_25319 [Catharanthus roseus]